MLFLMPPPHPLSCRSSPLAGSVLFARELDVLRKATLKGSICTKDRVVAGALLALSLPPLCDLCKISCPLRISNQGKNQVDACLLKGLIIVFNSGWTACVCKGKLQNSSRLGIPLPKSPLNADIEVCAVPSVTALVAPVPALHAAALWQCPRVQSCGCLCSLR